jgi:hypothetical protein
MPCPRSSRSMGTGNGVFCGSSTMASCMFRPLWESQSFRPEGVLTACSPLANDVLNDEVAIDPLTRGSIGTILATIKIENTQRYREDLWLPREDSNF